MNPLIIDNGEPDRPISIAQFKIGNIIMITTFGSLNNRFIITNDTFL